MDEFGGEPADRFVAEQRWWVASELARRHEGFCIREIRGSSYHAYLEVGRRSGAALETRVGPQIVLDVYQLSTPGPVPSARILLGQKGPHEVVKELEESSALDGGKTPATNGRTLTYRVLSKLLSLTLNERIETQVASARDFWTQHWDEDEYDRGYLAGFVGAQEAADHYPHLNRRHELDFFWAFLRGGEPVHILDESGRLYRPNGGPVDLMKVYVKNRSLDEVLAAVLTT